jgi:hypothetical protein
LLLWRLRVARSVPHPVSRGRKVFLLLFVRKKKSSLKDAP